MNELKVVSLLCCFMTPSSRKQLRFLLLFSHRKWVEKKESEICWLVADPINTHHVLSTFYSIIFSFSYCFSLHSIYLVRFGGMQGIIVQHWKIISPPLHVKFSCCICWWIFCTSFVLSIISPPPPPPRVYCHYFITYFHSSDSSFIKVTSHVRLIVNVVM